MAMTIYMTLSGGSSGAIKGDVSQSGREGQIQCYSLSHMVEIPRDSHTGLPVGQRVHKPLEVSTMIGKHTPQVFQAVCNGETVDVTLDFFRPNDKGLQEHYYQVKLKRARVVESKEWFPETFDPENKQFPHMHTIAYSYEKIVWTHVPDGIETEDDWNAPKLAAGSSS